MGSMTIDMRGDAPDRTGQGGAAAVLHHTPCSDAMFRRRRAISTNGARSADNVPSAQRSRQLRFASPQPCFLRSPPQAARLLRECPAATKARLRGRRWCAALLLLRTSLFRGLGITAGYAADIDAGHHTSNALPGLWKRPEPVWRWHDRLRRRRQWSRLPVASYPWRCSFGNEVLRLLSGRFTAYGR